MKNQLNNWTILQEKIQYDNPWIKVTEFDVITPGGSKGIYGKVHFKNLAIGVVPIDNEGNTAFHCAVDDGDFDIVNTLLRTKKININLANHNGFTPLHLSCLNANLNITNCLLQQKNINVSKLGNHF